MVKFLLILFILGFIFIKVNNFLFGTLYKILGVSPHRAKNSPRYKKSPKEGEIKIKYVSEEEQRHRKRSQEFRDGDYVDFEEVN